MTDCNTPTKVVIRREPKTYLTHDEWEAKYNEDMAAMDKMHLELEQLGTQTIKSIVDYDNTLIDGLKKEIKHMKKSKSLSVIKPTLFGAFIGGALSGSIVATIILGYYILIGA